MQSSEVHSRITGGKNYTSMIDGSKFETLSSIVNLCEQDDVKWLKNTEAER